MSLKNPLPADVIEAFHLMWGNFPESATLVHKSREVIAVNKACEKAGFCRPGMNCAKIGSPEIHQGCLANKALAAREAAHVFTPSPEGDVIGFWLPLDGYPEHYVHFSVGASMDYKTGSPKKSALLKFLEKS